LRAGEAKLEEKMAVLRKILMAALALVALSAGAQNSTAWPEKPMHIIIPGSAGSGPDLLARLMAEHMRKLLNNQNIIIDAMPGANGIVANSFVVKAPPDGYTILMGNASSIPLNAAVQKSLPYDTLKDLRPVVQLDRGGVLLLVSNSLGIKNLKEFIAYVGEHPGIGAS
jgi:tripartite-type tricarboxylate transporter receptor subunit TctC